MVRLVIYLVSLALAATGLAWLADRPGSLHVEWQGLDIETTVFRATVILAMAIATTIFLWSLLRTIWNTPAVLGERILKRRQKRGLEALSSGMIAVGAGDQSLATRYALQARKSLPHEPLTHLLRAQAAQLSGDRATARRIFESMLAAPDTEQLGLRGLFLEAEREGAGEAAKQFAQRALKSNAKLGWSADALFDLQCKNKDWSGALETLASARKNGHIEKTSAERRRAILLAGQAQDAEENESDKALALALEAHNLAPDLVAAAAVAGRILASKGNTGKAAKILQKTWAKAPHPELATVYAYARIGDSPRDRLGRIQQLAALNPHSIESPIAVATTAIDARLFNEARTALEPLLANRLTQRVATLMARVEAGEHGDKGRVREWLARAVHAARDPAWTADGIISERWEPISPVTGALDAFQWRVPVETLQKTGPDLVAERLEELLAISAPQAEAADAPATAASPQQEKAASATSASESSERHASVVEIDNDDGHPKMRNAKTDTAPVVDTTARHVAQTAVTVRDSKELAVSQNIPVPAKAVDAGVPAKANRPGELSAMAGKSASSEPAVVGKSSYALPHAPDDPGPDEVNEIEAVPVKRHFRAVK